MPLTAAGISGADVISGVRITSRTLKTLMPKVSVLPVRASRPSENSRISSLLVPASRVRASMFFSSSDIGHAFLRCQHHAHSSFFSRFHCLAKHRLAIHLTPKTGPRAALSGRARSAQLSAHELTQTMRNSLLKLAISSTCFTAPEQLVRDTSRAAVLDLSRSISNMPRAELSR
jgi:hypothetical protein